MLSRKIDIRYRYLSLIYVIVLLTLNSCKKGPVNTDLGFETKLAAIDTLIIKGEETKADSILQTINILDYTPQPKLANYYIIKSALSNSPHLMISNAQSALEMFKETDHVANEKELYFLTLVANGDAYYKSKNYITALNFFLEAENYIGGDSCKKGYLSDKFAMIYYDQKHYRTAAKYFLKSYQLSKDCNLKKIIRNSYNVPEMSVNNAALCYFKENQLDSANFYYQKYANLIDTALKNKTIDPRQSNLLKAVLYDNLGGLYLKQGKLNEAKDYLVKSIALPNENINGIRIPPYIKLATIFNEQKNKIGALNALNEAKVLLDKFKDQNSQSYIEWHKQYANYYYSNNELEKAYNYQNKYIAVKDSIESSYQEIKTIDLNRELKIIAQRQELNQFKHNDEISKIYVVGLIEFIILVIIIIFIIYFNLRKLKKIHQETLEKNQVITCTVEELERANKNYIRIMRIMAHDLRNPLSGMTGLASALLYEEEFDEENKKMLRLIESTGLHSIEMINELLKTGLANEDTKLEVQKIDLKSLLFDSVELLQFKAKEKRQTIVLKNEEPNEDPIFLNVNYEKIWRVLNNLIVNAIKFSQFNSIIKTGIKVYNTSIVIYVEDNGIGIPEKNKDAIFEMFTEAKKVGTNGEQPFGLGLSISKKIMEKHHGKIWFENNLNGGTTFYLEFPKS